MESTFECPSCRRLQLFEQPPCDDGHKAECPEWVCIVCGTALFVDVTLDVDVQVVTTRVA
ncbi:hypothetical protein [Actinopolymorpha alba]|uniref:hypothetical protein n=1 Tax=Actinopolymorpha alba TaxID=533267 RepID=UPI00068448C9|nr:hypothetical protein [Actinopolymorpha alba]